MDDDKQFLLFDWGEIKTGQQYIMTLHPNADSEDGWLLCSIHSIACNLICGSTVYKASAGHSCKVAPSLPFLLSGEKES
eukprot:scaffold13473_cov81-Skeletonema_marinoi.AAC.1